jgi:hypothetical protein
MSVAAEILSDLTVHMKYARYLEDKQRRETWEEIVTRNIEMHVKKYPEIENEIREAYKYVFDKKVLPSMRSLQFAGKPIEISPNRIFNCAYMPVDDIHAFSEAMFLLLGGTGVGYSVQKHHVERLPMLRGPIRIEDRRKRPRRFLIGDSIEGWADSIKALLNTYFKGEKEIEFDYRDIRPKGARLVTSGGKAPGPQPLKDCIHNIKKVLNTALEERGTNTKLKPIEAHDIMCLDSSSRVLTINGWEKIEDLVKQKKKIEVVSFNEKEKLYELKEIYNWYENDYNGEWYKINFKKNRSGRWGQLHAKFTPEHPILTSHGYKEVSELQEGDLVVSGEVDGDNIIKSVIFGSTLGDASLVKQGSTHFHVSHCESQKNYLDWIKSFFDKRGLTSSSSKYIIRKRKGQYKILNRDVIAEDLYTFNSSSRFFMDDYYDFFYSTGEKRVQNKEFVKSNLTELALAIWFMDDGSKRHIIGGWNHPFDNATIAVGNLPYNDLKILTEVIEEKFDIKSKIDFYTDKSSRIRFNKKEASKLFNLIKKYIPECMQYKLPIEYQGNYNFSDSIKNKPYYFVVNNIEKTSPRKKRKSYCIDVKDNHNFLTFSGIVHNCFIADAVLAGGIRRAAMISLFSFDDEEMLASKYGNWWELNPQRGRANNSVVALRHRLTKEDFYELWEKIKASGTGEPGLYFTNDKEWGTNPCFTGDMKVPLADGKGTIKTFEQLAKEQNDVPVYTLNDDGDIVVRKLRGVQVTRKNEDVYELELDNGDKIKATADHRFRLKDGSWKKLIDLAPGESLWPMSQYEAPLWDNKKSQNYRWINNKGKNNIEHRIIANQHYGLIGEKQVVHHIDFNALNNDPTNLRIIDKVEHDKLHGERMKGNNNPIFKVLNGPNSNSFKQKLSKANSGSNNPNSSDMTNEEIKNHALYLVKNLNRLPQRREWEAYSVDNNIPQLTSEYRKKELGSSAKLLIWAAIKTGILDKEYSNCHAHTLHSFYNWIDKGYTVRIHKNKIQFLNNCEITGKTFWHENPYKIYHPSVSASEAMKHFYDDHSNKVKRKQSIIKAHATRKERIREQQVEVYNSLKFELKREPLKSEWENRCKKFNLSDEISRKTSPFQSYSDLKETASLTNHKVVSVKYIGRQDVYDGVVDDFHNFFVAGDLNLNETTRKGIKKISFVNVANCCEIGLRPNQFCNLTTINASDVKNQEELEARAKAAAFIGTLQASYTDFHYLREIWRETTEKEALIGVSMTGIASGNVLKLDMREASHVVKEENKRIAKLIGINKAARTTCTKPEGSSSLVLGTSSGIHAWHNDYYLRRIRVGKNESIYTYLSIRHPELLEDEYFKPDQQAVITVPQKAPEGAITRHETAIDLLERMKLVTLEWVHNGHRSGSNKHNVSITVSVKDDEWDKVADWMWENRKVYNGITVLPHDGGEYKQAPFEDCSREEYERRLQSLKRIDLTQVIEQDDLTNLTGELACSGGACTIT